MSIYDPVVIASLLVLVLGSILFMWLVLSSGAETAEEPLEAEEDRPFSGDSIDLKIPRDLPHRSRFKSDGVETLSDLYDLDSLQDVHGIGPSRARDVFEWFEKSVLHSRLPSHLAPGSYEVTGSYEVRDEPLSVRQTTGPAPKGTGGS